VRERIRSHPSRALRSALAPAPGLCSGASSAPAAPVLEGALRRQPGPTAVCDTRCVTVNLTRIYTKLGDGGETHLGDMSRVSKLHPRVEAYGTVDELNAALGVALLAPGLSERFAGWLRRVQNDLLDVGADLSVPPAPPEQAAARPRLRVHDDYVSWLEHACDEVNATLPPLHSFVIPGGTHAAAQLHVCRTVCRRAERRAIAVGEDGNPQVVRYLNRLSDLLFILSRAANLAGDEQREGGGGNGERGGGRAVETGSATSREEPLWEPGAHAPGGEGPAAAGEGAAAAGEDPAAPGERPPPAGEGARDRPR